MSTYCNPSYERNPLLAVIHEQAAVIDQHPGEKPHTIIERCDLIQHHLEQLEQEEDARDRQANLQPPMEMQQQAFGRGKLDLYHSNDYNSVENLCLKFSDLALDEFPEDVEESSKDVDESPEDIGHHLCYCGDDGQDADSDYGTGDEDDDCDGCLNGHLSERLCVRRDCGLFGSCRIIEHELGSVCFCYE